jgi:hypothetical protein
MMDMSAHSAATLPPRPSFGLKTHPDQGRPGSGKLDRVDITVGTKVRIERDEDTGAQ